MKARLVLLFFLMPCMLGILPLQAADSENAIQFISHHASFKSVQEMAKQQNKPIFIDFTADWCGYCKRMDKRVFSQYTVSKFMNETFINYKVDIEKGNGPVLSMMYEVRMLPTVLFLSPDGKVMLRETHLFTGTKFMAAARRVARPYIRTMKPIHQPLDKITPCSDKSPKHRQPFNDAVRIPELAAEENQCPIILD